MASCLPSVSVVVPVYNEENCLREFIRRSIAVLDNLSNSSELIIVNDGSKDASAEIISEAVEVHSGKITGIFLNRCYGQHAAVLAGFSNAKGDIVVTLDADLQNPPEEIPKIVAESMKGHDVVASVRLDRRDSFGRRLISALLNRISAAATGVRIGDYGCMLRAYNRDIVDKILECDPQGTFIPVLAQSLAVNSSEIRVMHSARAAGESKYGIIKLIGLQFDFLTSLTIMPLRVLSLLGACLLCSGIVLGAFWMVVRPWQGSDWAFEFAFIIFALMLFLLGSQFMAMGLLGEYIGRMYRDLQGRPSYVISKTIGSSRLSSMNVELS